MLAASALMGGCLLGDSIDGVVTEDVPETPCRARRSGS